MPSSRKPRKRLPHDGAGHLEPGGQLDLRGQLGLFRKLPAGDQGKKLVMDLFA